MIETSAAVPTLHAAKYVKQLCNHWAHKLEVEQSEGVGLVRFPAAEARLRAGEEALVVTVGAEDEAILERMKSVLADHLDRFAFREAPLKFEWAPVR
ncbi:MAG TPA: DUF2218 domain-containing protein [Allosphingosinicella sp.]|nr:DUF2218 domain-containing protein [Allosphingosinicella sp.]